MIKMLFHHMTTSNRSDSIKRIFQSEFRCDPGQFCVSIGFKMEMNKSKFLTLMYLPDRSTSDSS